MEPRYLSDEDTTRPSDENFINDGEISEQSRSREKKVIFTDCHNCHIFQAILKKSRILLFDEFDITFFLGSDSSLSFG